MNENRTYGLEQEDFLKILNVLQPEKGVEESIIYGSRAIGNHKPGSDIDLVEKGRQLSIDHILNLRLALDELNLPYLFDLAIYDRIENQDLLDHI